MTNYSSTTVNAKEINPLALASVAAQHEREGLSNRYGFIPTTQVIDLLAGEGWLPVKATETKVRNLRNEGYQRHMIRFRQAESKLALGEVFPELVLGNGHDGMTAYTFDAGLWRLKCLNGLVVADSMFASIRVSHVGFAAEKVIGATFEVTKAIPEILDQVERFRAIDLTENERGVFAEAAALVKYDEADLGTKINPRALLAPHRYADGGKDLWTTYNVIQENLIKGGRHGLKQKRNRYSGRTFTRPVRARGTNAIDANVKINKALWHLTTEMAKMKSAA